MDNSSNLQHNMTTAMHSANVTAQQHPPPEFLRIICLILPIATVVLNIPAVLMVVLIILRKKSVKNVHLLSLGITDACIGISCYLMAETYLHTGKEFPFYDCWIRYFIFSIVYVASMLHVLGICVQRVIILSSNIQLIQYQENTFQWIVIIISWSLSFVLNSVPFVIMMSKARRFSICSIDSLTFKMEHMFNFYMGTTYIFIQLFVIIVMGILFGLLLKNKTRRKRLLGKTLTQKDLKLCITVAIIAVIFLACTIPLSACLVGYDYLGSDKRKTRAICTLFAVGNSAVNSAIYIFRVEEFQNLLKTALCSYSTQTSPQPDGSNLQYTNDLEVHVVDVTKF